MTRASSQRSKNFPAKLLELAEEVERLALTDPIDIMGEDGSSREAKYFLERSPRDFRTTVTIDGDRGVGKTTLLLLAMHALSEREDVVVLPVIRPEQFTEPESLFGRVLESLADYVFNCRPDLYESTVGGDELLSARFERLAGIEAVTRRDVRSSVAIESDASDTASDALMATRRGNELDAMWRPFVSEVLAALGVRKLVIPIDDADLSPQHLPWLLGDIRRLDDHQAVTCVLALNSHDLRDFLRGATLRMSGLEESSFPRIGSVVSRQVEKALPYQNWVRLRSWRPDRRLGFRDLGRRTATIEDLLAKVEFGGIPLGKRVRTPLGHPNQFANALPSRPRPLERLALELDAVDGRKGEDAMMHALEEHLDDALRDSADPIDSPLRWSRGEAGLEIELNLSKWSFFTDFETNGSLTLVGSVEQKPEPLEVEYSFPRGPVTVARTGRQESSPRLSQDAVGTVLLLLDIEARGGFSKATVSGGRPAQGGENWRRPRVNFAGAATDHDFLVPPRFDGYLEYFALNEGLDSILDALGDRQPHSTRDFVEWFAFSQLWLTHALHQDPSGTSLTWSGAAKGLDPANAPKIAGRSGSWGTTRKRIARHVMKLLMTAYLAAVEDRDRSRVENSYVAWFETYFLWSLHPAIFRADLVDELAGSWLSAVGQAGRAAHARAAAKEALRERLNTAGSAAWGDSVADLGERLGLGREFDSRRREAEAERSARRAELSAGMGKHAASVVIRNEGDLVVGVLGRPQREAVAEFVTQLIDRWGAVSGDGAPDRPIDSERRTVELVKAVLAGVRGGDLLQPDRSSTAGQ